MSSLAVVVVVDVVVAGRYFSGSRQRAAIGVEAEGWCWRWW